MIVKGLHNIIIYCDVTLYLIKEQAQSFSTFIMLLNSRVCRRNRHKFKKFRLKCHAFNNYNDLLLAHRIQYIKLLAIYSYPNGN